VKPITDRDWLIEWGLQHERCAACGADWGLQTHHLVKRSRRRMDRGFNLLRLCLYCHSAAEGIRVCDAGHEWVPLLSLSACLRLKREADPDEWEPEMLEELLGRPLPSLEEIPEFFTRKRRAYKK